MVTERSHPREADMMILRSSSQNNYKNNITSRDMRTMKHMEGTRGLSPMLKRKVVGKMEEIVTVLRMDWGEKGTAEKGMIINQMR